MKKLFFALITFCLMFTVQAQKKQFKCQDIYKAVKLIDEGKYDESIAILKECEKTDPTEHAYPYEIALAYSYKKEYQSAVDQLEKIKNYDGLGPDYYQLLGNNYDYVKNTKKAIATYDEGLKKFPNAGRLYLEKGVILEMDKKYIEAIASYEKGIEVDPMYSSNYFRAALLYLSSNNKLAGLIYGEIFMNLERTTKRTVKMSESLYEAYQKNITINGNNTKIDFCDIVIDANAITDKEIQLPFCAVFGNNFILATVGKTEINLESLSAIRVAFIENYFKNDYKKQPNVLLAYQKLLLDNGFLDTYNHYLFQMGAEAEFSEWKTKNGDKYNSFTEWYKNPANGLKITKENVFLSN